MYVMIAPPAVGPASVARPATPPQMPNAAPRRSGGNIDVMMASVCGVSSAPPVPWRMRAAISCSEFCASPQSAEAMVKINSPVANRLRWPNRSPNRPAVISSTVYTSRYALMTQRIWSSVALSPVLIAGIATFTIVVSSRIMKKPVVKTSKTSQGLVRACAMSPPQPLMAGIDSDLPLQLSVIDFFCDLAHPIAFRPDHRDLVLELDQHQSRVAAGQQLIEDVGKLCDHRLKGLCALLEKLRGGGGFQVVHEHEPRGEVGVLPARLCDDLGHDLQEDGASRVGEAVDRALGPVPFLFLLGRHDPSVPLERVHGVIERAEVQADELVVMALAHRRRELVRMHRPLAQQLEDGKAERRDIDGYFGCHIPNGILPR